MKYKANKYTAQQQQHGEHSNFHMKRYEKHHFPFFLLFFL